MSRAADVGACMYRAKFAREALLNAIAHGADLAVVETLREESERADAAHARAVLAALDRQGLVAV